MKVKEFLEYNMKINLMEKFKKIRQLDVLIDDNLYKDCYIGYNLMSDFNSFIRISESLYRNYNYIPILATEITYIESFPFRYPLNKNKQLYLKLKNEEIPIQDIIYSFKKNKLLMEIKF